MSNLIFEQIASETSIDSVLLNSQGLIVKEKGFEVSAPTGQISIIFPETSDDKVLSKYDVTSIFSPIPVAPSSGVPATSVAKRIHLVQ